MSYIKKIFDRKNIKPVLIVFLVLTALILELVSRNLASGLSSQQLVERWQSDEKYAQLSVFFKEGYEPDGDMILQYRAMMYDALKEAAIDTDKKTARVLLDAYSKQTTLTVSTEKNETTVRAFGVSKDYFMFHPEKLLSGNYFDNNDENADGIILDEQSAWTLFGAREVAGMYVDICGKACIIRGVIKCDEGLFSKASEEEIPTVYVDFDLLSEFQGGSLSEGAFDEEAVAGEEMLNESSKVSCYELLVQNPVNGFGKSTFSFLMYHPKKTYPSLLGSSGSSNIPFLSVSSVNICCSFCNVIVYVVSFVFLIAKNIMIAIIIIATITANIIFLFLSIFFTVSLLSIFFS